MSELFVESIRNDASSLVILELLAKGVSSFTGILCKLDFLKKEEVLEKEKSLEKLVDKKLVQEAGRWSD